MEPDYWRQRWAEGRTGWHLDEVNRLLLKHWPGIGATAGAPVFVPLCGKSVDMAWFASQGHPVVGVDVAEDAGAGFFAERGIEPVREHREGHVRLEGGDVELWIADVFALPDDLLAALPLVYDRAALIALPPALRRRYVDEVFGRLPAGCRGLLITLEYPQGERDGPPFSVEEDEVRALFEPAWTLGLLERRDILALEPDFAIDGVSRLNTCAWLLSKTASPQDPDR